MMNYCCYFYIGKSAYIKGLLPTNPRVERQLLVIKKEKYTSVTHYKSTEVGTVTTLDKF